MASTRSHTGSVKEFDEAVGLGVIRDDADGKEFAFHCTAISDGTRQIDVGVPVTFVPRAGHVGRVEAAQVTPLA